MIQYFLTLPTILICLFVITVSSAISIFALTIIRKKFNWETLTENHEFGGFLFNALGLIYAVLVAFVVYATWDEYENASSICSEEANTLQDLYLNSEGLPAQYRETIKSKVTEYLQAVIEKDWPLLGKEEANPESRNLLLEIGKVYMSMDTLNDDKEKAVFTQSLERLDQAMDYRRLRILSAQSHIPSIIWAVLLFGGLTSVAFSLFFFTKSFAVQATMTTLFVTTNVIILLLILFLDYPFTGDLKISPEPYIQILNYLKSP